MLTRAADPSREDRRRRRVDIGLSALMLLQGFTLFAAIPLGSGSPSGRILLDVCHLAFVIICIGVLTRHRGIQIGLLATLALLVAGPQLGIHLSATLNIDATAQHETIAFIAFAFNGGVTALVAKHVFSPGQVTVHRVRGAILLYLNIAALFAIADGVVAMTITGAFAGTGSGEANGHASLSTAAFSYFSLATITTTGYGDIVPVHPLARSLANLEAVFGQLFPATLLTRLVTLHLAAERGAIDTSGVIVDPEVSNSPPVSSQNEM